jgi:alpha-beta hydrolase superfamily lysophospholipase
VFSLLALRQELFAIASAAMATPLGRLTCCDTLEASPGDGAPVVLVHGLLGSRSNFRPLRFTLSTRGIRRFASFVYRPRIDYQRMAPELAELVERVCERSGAPHVDVVGHSLGGLIARYLLDLPEGRRIRRLVTLGSPYYEPRFPKRELAIFAEQDILVPAPPSGTKVRGRVHVVPHCGHLGLLHRRSVHETVAEYLGAPAASAASPVRPLARRAAA